MPASWRVEEVDVAPAHYSVRVDVMPTVCMLVGRGAAGMGVTLAAPTYSFSPWLRSVASSNALISSVSHLSPICLSMFTMEETACVR